MSFLHERAIECRISFGFGSGQRTLL